MENTLKLEMNQDCFQLLKLTMKALEDFSEFETVQIYENQSTFEVITTNSKKQFVTRTNICKFAWRVKNSFLKKPGEEEVAIIRKKK